MKVLNAVRFVNAPGPVLVDEDDHGLQTFHLGEMVELLGALGSPCLYFTATTFLHVALIDEEIVALPEQLNMLYALDPVGVDTGAKPAELSQAAEGKGIEAVEGMEAKEVPVWSSLVSRLQGVQTYMHISVPSPADQKD